MVDINRFITLTKTLKYIYICIYLFIYFIQEKINMFK